MVDRGCATPLRSRRIHCPEEHSDGTQHRRIQCHQRTHLQEYSGNPALRSRSP